MEANLFAEQWTSSPRTTGKTIMVSGFMTEIPNSELCPVKSYLSLYAEFVFIYLYYLLLKYSE